MRALLKIVCLFFLLFSRANAEFFEQLFENSTADSWRFVEQELCIKPQKELRKRWANYIIGCLGAAGGFVGSRSIVRYRDDIGYCLSDALDGYLNREEGASDELIDKILTLMPVFLLICGGLIGFYSWNYKLWRIIQFEALKSFLDCWDRNKRRIPEELFSTLASCHRVYASGEEALKKRTPAAMKKIRKRIQDHQRKMLDEIGLN